VLGRLSSRLVEVVRVFGASGIGEQSNLVVRDLELSFDEVCVVATTALGRLDVPSPPDPSDPALTGASYLLRVGCP
jgi:hypothetical protein